MSARIVKPEEAREMLDRACSKSAPEHLRAFDEMGLRNAAPDLAATVASEPERIAAAVAAERERIVADLREWARQSAHRTGNYADALTAAADEVEAGREP